MPKAGNKIIQLKPSPAPTFQIRSENLSARCEVCHQTDCYDPLTNQCSRCSEIAPIMLSRQYDAIQATEWTPLQTHDDDEQFVSYSVTSGTYIGLVLTVILCWFPFLYGIQKFIFDPGYYLFFGGLILTGLISGIINGLFLKEIPGHSMNNLASKFFCWLTCVILSALGSGMILGLLISMSGVITPAEEELTWVYVIMFSVFGGINGMFNSIVLLARKIERHRQIFGDLDPL